MHKRQCDTIDTRIPATDPLRFRKNLLHTYQNDSH